MDYNHSGTIDAHEMRTAFKKAGEDMSWRQRFWDPVVLILVILIMTTANENQWSLSYAGNQCHNKGLLSTFPLKGGRTVAGFCMVKYFRLCAPFLQFWEGDSNYKGWSCEGGGPGEACFFLLWRVGCLAVFVLELQAQLKPEKRLILRRINYLRGDQLEEQTLLVSLGGGRVSPGPCTFSTLSCTGGSAEPSTPPVTQAPLPAGFMLSNQVQQTIATRYACSKLSIDFDGFVACMIRLETLFSESLCSLTPSHFSQDAGRGRGRTDRLL